MDARGRAGGRRARFNEASALQRRKLDRAVVMWSNPGASMRPPLFSGGNTMRPML